MRHKELVESVFQLLDDHYGDLRWWPGNTRIEVIVGAILTQNTAWSNVEKAISSLKRGRLLSLAALRRTPLAIIARHIRPSGYYNQKSTRLKNFVRFLDSAYGGSLRAMAAADTATLRGQLLSINGIGPETADSILLYAFKKRIFVVDAYTRRIFGRLGVFSGTETYDEVRMFFEDRLRPDVRTYNQYHALIVNLGKDFCRKGAPRCGMCPLRR